MSTLENMLAQYKGGSNGHWLADEFEADNPRPWLRGEFAADAAENSRLRGGVPVGADQTGDWPVIGFGPTGDSWPQGSSAAVAKDYRTAHDKLGDIGAFKPFWGDTQWRGPDGYEYLPFPAKDSQFADFLLTSLMGLGAVRGSAMKPPAMKQQGLPYPEYTPTPSPRKEFGLAAEFEYPPPVADYLLSNQQISKMAALGYDPGMRYYRGGNREFAGVIDPKGNYGFKYLADRPDVANIYAAGAERHDRPARVTPVVAKKEGVISVDYGGRSWSDQLFPNESAAKQLALDLGRRYNMEEIAKAAREKGYNMVAFRNLHDMGGWQTQYIPLTQNALRSPWARFDPAQAASGDIMAGLGAPAIAVPALASLLAADDPRGD